jgi:hypothetical protein
MERLLLRSGDTAALIVCEVKDERIPANEPCTGLAVTLTIQRVSDGKFWDWTASEWDTVATWAALGSEHKTAMTDGKTGWYYKAWNQATADTSAEADYVATFCIASGNYQGMERTLLHFRLDELRMEESHAKHCCGVLTDSGDGTVKIYDGPDPDEDNLLFTLTKTEDGDQDKWVRS